MQLKSHGIIKVSNGVSSISTEIFARPIEIKDCKKMIARSRSVNNERANKFRMKEKERIHMKNM